MEYVYAKLGKIMKVERYGVNKSNDIKLLVSKIGLLYCCVSLLLWVYHGSTMGLLCVFVCRRRCHLAFFPWHL